MREFNFETEDNKISITYDGSTAAFESIYEIKDNELNIKDSFGNVNRSWMVRNINYSR